MKIRPERSGDEKAIESVITAAFARAPHSDGNEAAIVARLRESGGLAMATVAEEGCDLVGYAAFSPVTIGSRQCRWFGLGPFAVSPNRQREGIGSALIEDGLSQLVGRGAAGCVVLGDPGFYGRFGFKADRRLILSGPPPEYFLALPFAGTIPRGIVRYHPAFG